VLCGMGDAAATTLGAGVSDASQCYAYLGTSGWVARVCHKTADRLNPPGAPLFVLPYLPPTSDGLARRILIGPISNAGAVHRWALVWLDASADTTEAHRYALFEQAVASAPFDAKLMFLPYLNSERLPVSSSAGQGAVVGLSMDTTRAQLMRAALEGVSLSLRWALDLLQDSSGSGPTSSRELIVVGGATRSAQWMQILANCFDAPLHIPPDADLLPCLGAAATAAVALGWCASPEAFVRRQRSLSSNLTDQTVYPEAEAAAQMQAKSSGWRALQAAVSTLSSAPT
jgi:xylulokinase